MAPKIRHIATRFALILAVAAVLPLVAYGIASIWSLERGTRATVVTGNLNVAVRAADEIRRYIITNAEILKTLAADLQDTGLQPWQQDRILKNYVLQFREFHEITLFDEGGAPIATSRVGRPRVAILEHPAVTIGGVAMSPMRVDEDLLPTSTFAIHLMRLNQPAGWLVAELSLEQMWRMVDEIRIGSHGFALVVAPDGRLIAHGDPDKKTLIAQSRNLVGHHPLVSAGVSTARSGSEYQEYVDDEGRTELAVAAPIAELGWALIVEQPTAEAYAGARQLRRQLLIAIFLALLVMVAIGWLFGRRFIAPIFALQRATQAVADGRLETRVTIESADEFGKLGEAFNTMANRLIELQENVKRQERHAMFGRIVGGLFHDLSHPLQIVASNTGILLRDPDPEQREHANKVIQQEVGTLRRLVDDLRNVQKPKPLERFGIDVNRAIAEVADSLRAESERTGVALETRLAPAPLVISGDWFALRRAYRNLVANAIEATPRGGRVSVNTQRDGDTVEVGVSDTGCGIAPERLSAIFDDFVTTKKKGLGLGLVITKQIVEQLDGSIAVQSELGRGTSFTLRFPARDDLAAKQAAS
jgi:signal transduction histidine kinase